MDHLSKLKIWYDEPDIKNLTFEESEKGLM